MSKISCPISTISYNTHLFLINKLNTLIYLRFIRYYEFISHLPDNDDKKAHTHLYIIPNKSIDLLEFQELFVEPISIKNIHKVIKKFVKIPFSSPFIFSRSHNKLFVNKYKPLKCLPFRKSSKYGDWYWYGLHNKDYLRSKGLERNKFYSDSDIFCSDLDFHNVLILENPLQNYCTMGDNALVQFVLNSVNNGVSLSSILSSGVVPLSKTQQVCILYNSLCSSNGSSCGSASLPTIDKMSIRLQVLKQIEELKQKQCLTKLYNNISPINGDLPFNDDLF